MGNQAESLNREREAGAEKYATDVLEQYRMTAYGSARNDFSTVESALFGASNKLAVACKAMHGLDLATDSDTTGLIMGVEDILNEVLQIMNQALSLLEDCELKRG